MSDGTAAGTAASRPPCGAWAGLPPDRQMITHRISVWQGDLLTCMEPNCCAYAYK